ncbi:MAG: 2-oxoglutarate dehydrogenase E1 component [Leptospirales bacterium]|nr:2-oxoglutarate dehydrogenase E1 component [Leptospirales bacterium]
MSRDQSTSVLNSANLEILEQLYEQFSSNPQSVPADWREFFIQMERSPQAANAGGAAQAVSLLAGAGKLAEQQTRDITDLHMKALLLVQAYRRHGHFAADTDPLGFKKHNRDHLGLEDHRLTEADLDRDVIAWIGAREVRTTLRNLVARMEKTYCSSIGVEFFYIRDEDRRRWMMERLESEQHLSKLPANVQLMIFDKLYNAEYFEKFIHTRFPGKKRFSLEGGESLIPALSSIIENADRFNIQQIVLGMAHRGRLNVLTNILGKDPAQIFAEFNENLAHEEEEMAGDVKYHLGYSNDVETLGGQRVHLSLAFNPSHLEVINAVVLGSCRARQTRSKDQTRSNNLPVLIHGDAALAGQGINYETLNMSGLRGYSVGGAIHIVVNNQIGFTTEPSDSRSTQYCTDVAKMLQSPIFHVNGNDPEACYRAIMLSLEFRQRFQSDVFLDIICYRRWGHNETDEPAFTQPVVYNRIRHLPTTAKIYEDRLLAEGIHASEIQAIKDRVHARLEEALQRVKEGQLKVEMEAFSGAWSGFQKAESTAQLNPETGVDREHLEVIAEHITRLPEGFRPNSKIARLLEQRRQMSSSRESRLDWGMAETLAYGSLLMEGTSIRISGQDAKRGTFSHRHAAIFDMESGAEHIALASLNSEARFEVINSLLSEEAVLGFEFGFSLADPRHLTIWEAQFGDFVNGAQVVIDQFICSCEAKWNRQSGLVMLLPHGYEGQGPEHSSARPERFLQLCSQNNIQVCNPSTPAQYFHLIRRQMKRQFRKPLIVLSPKSLLRLPEAASSFGDLCEGRFQEVIDERDPAIDPKNVERVLFCTGKIYYELVAERKKREQQNVAIVSVEQLYLYPVNEIAGVLQRYSMASEVGWVQEEPRNQGAWTFIESRLNSQLRPNQRLHYFGRTPSPSPATGYHKVHQREQQGILDAALKLHSHAAMHN